MLEAIRPIPIIRSGRKAARVARDYATLSGAVCKHYSPSATLLISDITGISYLQHILAHADIARLGIRKSTGALDGVHAGVRIGNVDPTQFIQIIAGTQRGIFLYRGRRQHIEQGIHVFPGFIRATVASVVAVVVVRVTSTTYLSDEQRSWAGQGESPIGERGSPGG